MAKTIDCANCGAENQGAASSCFACGVPMGHVNVHKDNNKGGQVATGEVLTGARAASHAKSAQHRRALAHPGRASKADPAPTEVDAAVVAPKAKGKAKKSAKAKAKKKSAAK